MDANLLSQGFELLVYGMGTVVIFLTLLVFATRGMSFVVRRFFPEASPAHSGRIAMPSVSSTAVSSELLAAIAAAVHQHRRARPVVPASDFDQRKTHV